MGSTVSVSTVLSTLLVTLLLRLFCSITCKVTKKTDIIPFLVKTFILYEHFLVT